MINEDNKEKVKAMADKFRKQSAERRAKLAADKKETSTSDRQVKAAQNYLKKASHEIARRKADSSTPTTPDTKSKVKTKTKIKSTKTSTTAKTKKEPKQTAVKKKSSILKKSLRTIINTKRAIDKINPNRYINKQISKVQRKFDKWLDEENMDDLDTIMSKFTADELENMSPEEMRAAMLKQPDQEETAPAEAPEEVDTKAEKTPEEEHAEKMPDNGPTPEDETPETVVSRYAKAISGLSKRQSYSTFSSVKDGQGY